LTYSIYYKNPFSVEGRDEVEKSEALKELGTPRDVYGSLERDSMGDIRLDEGEVVPEGEEQA
jgi:hypothetical protein